MTRKTERRNPRPAPAADGGTSTIHLGSRLGIEDAAALHRQLVEAVDEPRAVVLEARDVRDVHTAALELFCLVCRDRRVAGRETRWQEPSEALRSAAALLGITALMSLAQQGVTP